MTTTPDPTLAARLAELHVNDPVGLFFLQALTNAYRSGQLITLADHTAAVAKVRAEDAGMIYHAWCMGRDAAATAAHTAKPLNYAQLTAIGGIKAPAAILRALIATLDTEGR